MDYGPIITAMAVLLSMAYLLQQAVKGDLLDSGQGTRSAHARTKRPHYRHSAKHHP
jgi:hypothetical protein